MVQRPTLETLDDLTGEVITKVTHLRWTWNNTPLVLDVGPESLTRIRGGDITLAELLAASRKDAAVQPPRRVLRANNQKVREWARQHGHDVSDRGRISEDILEAYDAAHPTAGTARTRPPRPRVK